MNRRDIPNIISMGRILLVPLVVWLLMRERFAEALLLFAVAGASDALDGYLAKHFHWTSRLGSILDPLADKLLLVSSYLALGWLGIIPVWLVAAVIVRDALILFGAIAYHYLIGHVEMAPTLVSKINTLAQIVLVLALVMSLSLMPLPPWAITGMIYFVLATTVLSGLDYFRTWTIRALRVRSGRHCR